ncbi:MAG: hypothetical protein JKY32_07860 [Rhizobiales bacterium]|nr:hypothetical protein [Hyphomicrobiales bacterium]
MIENHDGKIELTCDDCGEISGRIEAEGNADVLRADARRDHGGRRFQRGLQWRDACGDCVAKWAQEQRGQGRFL